MTSSSSESVFADHKIISSECKSWFVSKPGTNKNSFSVTWSPGAVLLYGEKGNITLIYSRFNTYEGAKKWFSGCSIDEFKAAIAHNHPDDLDFFYLALKHWGSQTHYV
jgi:hypothetical protein